MNRDFLAHLCAYLETMDENRFKFKIKSINAFCLPFLFDRISEVVPWQRLCQQRSRSCTCCEVRNILRILPIVQFEEKRD